MQAAKQPFAYLQNVSRRTAVRTAGLCSLGLVCAYSGLISPGIPCMPLYLAAGMKVIGVTTTLSAGEMQLLNPDKVFCSISSISVSDLVGV